MKIQVQCYAGYRGEQEPRSSAPVRLRSPWCGLDTSEFISTARSAARRINHHWPTRAVRPQAATWAHSFLLKQVYVVD
jgi:hypothetical protein